jgi:hypothetical protein
MVLQRFPRGVLSTHSALWFCNGLQEMFDPRLLLFGYAIVLKGPKHEIFESEFFIQIRPVRVDDLGTGEKNDILQVGAFILRFSLRISY